MLQVQFVLSGVAETVGVLSRPMCIVGCPWLLLLLPTAHSNGVDSKGLQGLYTLDLQASLKVMLHFVGAMIFMWGGMTHVQAIEPVYAAAALGSQDCALLSHTPVATAAAFRRVSIAGVLPVIGFVLPLGFQVVQFVYGDGSSAGKKNDNPVDATPRKHATKSQGVGLDENSKSDKEEDDVPPTNDAEAHQSPGMSNGMGAMQWGIVVLFASFYASYAPDLYFAGASARLPSC